MKWLRIESSGEISSRNVSDITNIQLKVRDGPNIESSNVIGYLNVGDIVRAFDEPGAEFYELIDREVRYMRDWCV